MADSTLHSMTQNTTPVVTDELYLLDDPSGVPANNRITASNLLRVINGMTEDTAPDRTVDYLVEYDTSAVSEKKVLLTNVGVYVLEANFALTSPTDATTYFFGPFPSATMGVTAANHKVYIPRAGKVIAAYLFFTFVNGSSETSTISFRLNDTTDTTISSTLNLSSTPLTVSNTSLSIAVATGDWFTIKWVTPTWVTNPTNCVGNVKFFVA